jgi:hypothetical protein
LALKFFSDGDEESQGLAMGDIAISSLELYSPQDWPSQPLVVPFGISDATQPFNLLPEGETTLSLLADGAAVLDLPPDADATLDPGADGSGVLDLPLDASVVLDLPPNASALLDLDEV